MKQKEPKDRESSPSRSAASVSDVQRAPNLSMITEIKNQHQLNLAGIARQKAADRAEAELSKYSDFGSAQPRVPIPSHSLRTPGPRSSDFNHNSSSQTVFERNEGAIQVQSRISHQSPAMMPLQQPLVQMSLMNLFVGLPAVQQNANHHTGVIDIVNSQQSAQETQRKKLEKEMARREFDYKQQTDKSAMLFNVQCGENETAHMLGQQQLRNQCDALTQLSTHVSKNDTQFSPVTGPAHYHPYTPLQPQHTLPLFNPERQFASLPQQVPHHLSSNLYGQNQCDALTQQSARISETNTQFSSVTSPVHCLPYTALQPQRTLPHFNPEGQFASLPQQVPYHLPNQPYGQNQRVAPQQQQQQQPYGLQFGQKEGYGQTGPPNNTFGQQDGGLGLSFEQYKLLYEQYNQPANSYGQQDCGVGPYAADGYQQEIYSQQAVPYMPMHQLYGPEQMSQAQYQALSTQQQPHSRQKLAQFPLQQPQYGEAWNAPPRVSDNRGFSQKQLAEQQQLMNLHRVQNQKNPSSSNSGQGTSALSRGCGPGQNYS